MNVSELNAKISAKIDVIDSDWYIATEGRDTGTCGMAVLLVTTGRNRKVVKFLEESGILGHPWENWRGRTYTVNTKARGKANTQNINYYELCAEAARDVVGEFLAANGFDNIEVHVHSWVD